MSSQSKVILITGCSTGFGREMALSALSQNLRVIATARRPEVLDDLKEKGATTLKLDVDRPVEELDKFAKQAIGIHGQIDILINNAGWLQGGALEELTSDQRLTQFQTLFFSLINLTNAFLPHMRERKSGTIINISSQGAFMNIAGAGIYCAAKAAVDSITDIYSKELSPSNIRVVAIQPGSFRTAVAGSTNLRRPDEDRIIDGYDAGHQWLERFSSKAGKEPGDTAGGAERIVKLALKEGRLPRRLPLGDDAVKNAKAKAEEWAKETEEWKQWGSNLTLKE